MATLRDALLPVIRNARSITGQLGFRQHRVELVDKAWDGETGVGLEDERSIRLAEAGENPKVRWMTDEQLAAGNAGGQALPKGTVTIGPLTPKGTDGGVDVDTLVGRALDRGDERFVRITGPQHPKGALYRIVSVSCDRPLRHVIVAKPEEAEA